MLHAARGFFLGWTPASRRSPPLRGRALARATSWLLLFSAAPALSLGEGGDPLRSSSLRSLLLREIPAGDIEWLRERTKELLRACRIRGRDGVSLYTPDASGHYRALWTRDFSYMVEYAGDLIEEEEIRASILYILGGRRNDGCIPDRVEASGRPVYSPGGDPPLADHALDNAAFLARLAAIYVERTADLAFLRRIEPALRRGLDHVRRSKDGLVYNPPGAPQCPYGFTDTVAKTGRLLVASLLYYDACRRLAELCRRAGCGDPDEYARRAQAIHKGLDALWDEEAGMFLAADRDCRQIDIWGSALAVAFGCAEESKAERIAGYLVEHYEGIVQRGQVRHLPPGETWERLLVAVPPGTYQNGAFWATPLPWIVPVIARRNPSLAVRTVRDVLADFRTRGVMECVNGTYTKVPGYVASATNVYGLLHDPAAARAVVWPEDTGGALQNPAMGWTMHFYSNRLENYGSKLEPSDSLAAFPGCSVVYLRLPWAFLEPEEGRFNWSLLDTPAQRWIDRGGKVALRVTCSESWLRYATPKWVQEAGARGYDFAVGRGIVEGGPFWEPDFGDPVFLAKLEAFLRALARRYDGNPHVAFVDVGSFGVWGEGHTWASTKKEYPDEVKRRHIDLHLKYFRETLLAANDDLIGPANKTARHPLADYMLRRGVTIRDDSICVQPPPNSWYHADLAQSFWPRLPVILEHEHYGASVARGAWGDGSLLARAVEEYHAAYLSIHWWPYEFLERNREAIARINRRLGYRLQLRGASWPRRVAVGEAFEWITSWANAGVAPCYPGGFVCLTLKDAQGGIVWVDVNEQADVRTWKTGPSWEEAPVSTLRSSSTIGPELGNGQGSAVRPGPGDYEVWVSVGSRDGTPVIALPLPDGDGRRRYRLGRLSLTPGSGK